MSFKREGDDTNWLTQLRKRRTDELLSENVPDGEAKLLCNGRLACVVCHQRPVFDTVSMLHVHRAGKKHLAAAERWYENQQELSDLVLKRKQEDILRTGSTTLTMPTTAPSSILPASCAYNPKTRKLKPNERKRRLCLDNDLHQTTASSNNSPTTTGQILDNISHTGKQPKQLKHIFEKGTQNMTELKPYVKKVDLWRKNVDDLPANPAHHKNMSKTGGTIQFRRDKNCVNNLPTFDKHKHDKTRTSECAVNMTQMELEKVQRNKRNLKLIESGWRKNRGGEWERDEDCEFDTDEEDPN